MPLPRSIVMQPRGAVVGLVMLAGACGGPRISKQVASKAIESAPLFTTAKIVYVPRTIAIPANGIGSSSASREGEALTLIEIASVDPVVAALRARDWITIEDFVSAVPGSVVEAVKAPEDSTADDSTKAPNDSTKPGRDSTGAARDTSKHDTIRKPTPSLDEPHTSPPPVPPLAQQWVHTLRVTPRPQLQGSDLAPDDGEDNPESPRVMYGARPVGRTPGWTLAVGSRELVRVLDVTSYTPAHGEPPGELYIEFAWHWRSTKNGAPFDTESAEYESLPREVQQAALTGGVTMDGTTHWSRATVARDGTSWKVTSVDWSYGDDKPHPNF